MTYQYRSTANNTNTNNNKGSHYVNLKFADGNGEQKHLRNKFISLKDTVLEDAYLIEQYELARKEWELSEDENKPETFHFTIMMTADIVPAITERAAPTGRMANVAVLDVPETEAA